MNNYLKEVLLDRIEIEKFSNESGAFFPEDHSEEYEEVVKQLIKRLRDLAEKTFTNYQRRILHLMLLGKTKREIATILNLNSVAVLYAIKGVYVYKRGRKRKTWGGIVPKFRKLVKQDEEVQRLLKKIYEMRHADY